MSGTSLIPLSPISLRVYSSFWKDDHAKNLEAVVEVVTVVSVIAVVVVKAIVVLQKQISRISRIPFERFFKRLTI